MLNERIRSLCNSRGISIPKLEENLGFGAGTISKWKTSSPGSDKLAKVAIYFQVSVDWLLGLNTNASHSEFENVLIENFRKLNRAGQDAVIDYVNNCTFNPKYTGTPEKEKTTSA